MRADQAGFWSKQGVVECTALLVCMLERNRRNAQQLNRAQGMQCNVTVQAEVDPAHHTILLSFKLSTSLLFE